MKNLKQSFKGKNMQEPYTEDIPIGMRTLKLFSKPKYACPWSNAKWLILDANVNADET